MFQCVCLSVCLFVRRITQKRMIPKCWKLGVGKDLRISYKWQSFWGFKVTGLGLGLWLGYSNTAWVWTPWVPSNSVCCWVILMCHLNEVVCYLPSTQVLHWWWRFEAWMHFVVWNPFSIHRTSLVDHNEAWSTLCPRLQNLRFDSRQYSSATTSCLQTTRPDHCFRTCLRCRCQRRLKIKSHAPFLGDDSKIILHSRSWFTLDYQRHVAVWHI